MQTFSSSTTPHAKVNIERFSNQTIRTLQIENQSSIQISY